MTRKVTYACMTFTDGHDVVYAAYRAVLHESLKRSEPYVYVDLSRAERVGEERTTVKPANFDYFALAKKYESPEYPAFSFHRA